jgi:hypothetical protein
MDAQTKPPKPALTASVLPFKYTRAGKIRPYTIDQLDKRTIAFRLVQQRIRAIEVEEFDGSPTLRQHQAVVNDVMLSLIGETMGVMHLSGQPLAPARLVDLVNAQRQERKSRNE